MGAVGTEEAVLSVSCRPQPWGACHTVGVGPTQTLRANSRRGKRAAFTPGTREGLSVAWRNAQSGEPRGGSWHLLAAIRKKATDWDTGFSPAQRRPWLAGFPLLIDSKCSLWKTQQIDPSSRKVKLSWDLTLTGGGSSFEPSYSEIRHGSILLKTDIAS